MNNVFVYLEIEGTTVADVPETGEQLGRMLAERLRRQAEEET